MPRKNPQDGENPLINSSYYKYQMFNKEREYNKVKIDLPNDDQSSPVKSEIFL